MPRTAEVSAGAMHRAHPRLSLADKVEALRQPASYPERSHMVDALETHMSWVFLTDEYVYKLKKPVRYDHQHFGTVSGRRFYCEEELRLNRRLAPSVYLEVLPLVVGGDGRLRVGGAGAAVDWLVKMRRLPADAMLDATLARGAATASQLQGVGRRLAAFHKAQAKAPLSPAGYRALLLRHTDEYERDLCAPAGGLPRARVAALCERQRTMLGALSACLDARVAAGRVIEAHGDLRPEHVYLGEPPSIIDCLEFSPELRWLDGADEVGFLALECERARAGSLGRVLLESWREAIGDSVSPALVHFYQSCRACSRARLAIRHLLEARYRGSPQWRRRTLRYLALAERHLKAANATLAPATR